MNITWYQTSDIGKSRSNKDSGTATGRRQQMTLPRVKPQSCSLAWAINFPERDVTSLLKIRWPFSGQKELVFLQKETND
jgi:hypothetical protein